MCTLWGIKKQNKKRLYLSWERFFDCRCMWCQYTFAVNAGARNTCKKTLLRRALAATTSNAHCLHFTPVSASNLTRRNNSPKPPKKITCIFIIWHGPNFQLGTSLWNLLAQENLHDKGIIFFVRNKRTIISHM